MSEEGVERVLCRLLTDNSYRQLAKGSVASACRETGYDLTGERLLSIRRRNLVRIELITELLNYKIKQSQLD